MTDTAKDMQVRFIGKMLSVFTHEMANHLAVINELAGLLSDMCELDQEGESSRYGEIAQSITRQVKVSSALIKYVNRLGHRMDAPLQSVNINEVIAELLALLARVAHQKRITIHHEPDPSPADLATNPSLLQCIVSLLIMELIEKGGENMSITIYTRSTSQGREIIILPSENIPPGPSDTTTPLSGYVKEELFGSLVRESNGVTRIILKTAVG